MNEVMISIKIRGEKNHTRKLKIGNMTLQRLNFFFTALKALSCLSCLSTYTKPLNPFQEFFSVVPEKKTSCLSQCMILNKKIKFLPNILEYIRVKYVFRTWEEDYSLGPCENLKFAFNILFLPLLGCDFFQLMYGKIFAAKYYHDPLPCYNRCVLS